MALERGIEVIELDNGGVIVEEVRSSVVFLIGTAPVQLSSSPTINEPVIVSDPQTMARYFGSSIDPRTEGYTLPLAYHLMGLNANGLTIVVNVFNPDTMRSPVTDELNTFNAAGQIALMPKSVVSTVKSQDGLTTYPATAYTYDSATGILARSSSSPIPAAAGVLVSYQKPDPSLVDQGDIIGGTDVEFRHTGLSLIGTCRGRFGYNPKIILAPWFSQIEEVAQAMERHARKSRAVALIDAQSTATIRQALESRGSNSVVGSFRAGSDNNILLYPEALAYDPATEQTRLVPYSAVYAGIIIRTDRERGYWYSPSSKEMSGVSGLAHYPVFDPEDFDTETNQLNELGIVTAIKRFGAGFVTFGNRNASYPSQNNPLTFIPTRRTLDMVYESVIWATLQYLDEPLTRGFITAVQETVNEYLNVLIGRGALYQGSVCLFDPSRNPQSELVQGRPRFTLRLMSPPPVEKITYEAVIDKSLVSVVFEPDNGLLV